jgi:tetratricopeptide (TPR) repeat protein
MRKIFIFIVCLLIRSACGFCSEDIFKQEFPNQLNDRLEKLEVYFETGLYDDAADILDELSGQFPNERRFVYLRGILDYQRGNYELARRVFVEFIREHPDVPEPYYILSDINMKQDNKEQAREYLAEYCRLAPEDFSAQARLRLLRDKLRPASKTIFDFEKQIPYWQIPDWCFEKNDYVGKKVANSRQFANKGKSSLKVLADFPGKKWSAVYFEVQEYLDWTPYQDISADVYVPADAPSGLKAKIILTVGDNWKWIEMNRLVKLTPGEWTTITANLVPGSNDWRRTEVTDEFRSDVRKLGIRVESNMRPVYNGSIYVDNVRVE